MMRLLFVTASLEAGGAERQWQRLLTGMINDGHEATVLAVGAEGPLAEAFRSDGIEVAALGLRNRIDLTRLAHAVGAVARSADLLVSKDPSAMCIAAVAGQLSRTPHIHTDHNPIRRALHPRREWLTRRVAPSLTSVVLVSDRQREAWTARRVQPAKLQVIANGVDPPRRVDRAQVRAALGLQADDVAVTLTATLRPEKRVTDFVEAVRCAQRANPKVVGLVAGGGDELPLLRDRVRDDPGFRVLGHREDVSAVLAASDMCVLSSSVEAQPMAVLEAMACGLPVVATAVGDMDRLVESGTNGWLVGVGDVERLGERIAQLATDIEQRAAFGRESLRRWDESWRADLMVQRYEALFSALLRRRRR
jgi:glycosyltransferase involved in cell wall biosynthesis